jgi:hypothetical protein
LSRRCSFQNERNTSTVKRKSISFRRRRAISIENLRKPSRFTWSW